MSKKKEQERQEAIEQLRILLPPGTTVNTILYHVSRSGMARDIACVIGSGEEVRVITWLVAKALGMSTRTVMGSNATACAVLRDNAVVLAKAVASQIGVGIEITGDPRGAAIRLLDPRLPNTGFAGDGYCVAPVMPWNDD